MFGIVPRDTFGKNITVRDNLTVDASIYTSYRTPTRTVIVVPPFDNSTNEVVYTLVINIPGAKIGDIVIVFMSTTGGLQDITLNLPSNLYVTNCGKKENSLDITNYSSFAMFFQFDGEVFVQTKDNC